MTKSQAKLIKEFRDGTTHGTASNMFVDGDTLYSYGHHFPLAVRYEGPEGYTFLINADRYSISTACQQNRVFDLGPQIPFSALQAASLNPRRVGIVDVRKDDYHEIPDPKPDDPDHVRIEHTLGATLIADPRGRFYLSSLDENEPWRLRSYFLCQLPGEVLTVAEAYENLVPDRVQEWKEKHDDGVRRQGEWFFLPSDIETRHLPRPTYRMAPLQDTDHFVTELRRNQDLYARGTVYHMPEQRRPQHKRLSLRRTWHEAAKNLAVASWNAEGMVD